MTTTLQPGPTAGARWCPAPSAGSGCPIAAVAAGSSPARQRIVISALNLTAFFVIWQLVATYGSVPTLYLPSVTDVFGRRWSR